MRYAAGVNLLLVDAAELDGERVRLRDRRARHVVEVLRAGVGDTVRVGVTRGPRGTGTVVDIGADHVELALVLDGATDAEPATDLVLALPRPKALSRIVQTAASFGVGRIDLVNAWRVDKSYLSSARLAADRLDADARLGCEQGSTTWLPDIAVHRRLMTFVDESLAPRLARAGTTGLIAHPAAQDFLEDAVATWAHKLIVLIGPEGGWIPREVDTLIDRGCRGVTLGSRLLRTHAAVAAVFAQLDMLRRTRS